jgi:hypothetical protein
MPGQRHRHLYEARQFDLFGSRHAQRPATMPSWRNAGTPRDAATSLIVRLLVEHAGSDLQSGPIGGRDDS